MNFTNIERDKNMSKEIMTRKYHRKHYLFELYVDASCNDRQNEGGHYADKFYCDSFEEADEHFCKKWNNYCCYINHYFKIYDRYEKCWLTEEEVEKLMNM